MWHHEADTADSALGAHADYVENLFNKIRKNKQCFKAKQLSKNLSNCDTTVVEACNLIADGYEATIAVSKPKCDIFYVPTSQSCLVDYEAYVDASKVCEKETVTDCR